MGVVHERGGIGAIIKQAPANNPKSISYDERGGLLRIGLWPEEAQRMLDLRRYHKEIRRGFPDYETGGKTSTAQGFAKTHEVWLYFLEKDESPVGCAELAAAVQNPPTPWLGDDWYARTEAAGYIHPYAPRQYPRMEAMARLLCDAGIIQTERAALHNLQFRSDGHFDKRSGTVAVWFKPSQSLLDNWGHLFAEHYRLCDLFVSGKRVFFRTPSGRLGSKFQGLEADEWVHVAVTWDLATGRSAIYVNGALDGEHQGEPAELPTQGVFHIGGDEHSRQSRRGVYDEFRIYNRPLSAEEVRRLADETIQPPPFEY